MMLNAAMTDRAVLVIEIARVNASVMPTFDMTTHQGIAAASLLREDIRFAEDCLMSGHPAGIANSIRILRQRSPWCGTETSRDPDSRAAPSHKRSRR